MEQETIELLKTNGKRVIDDKTCLDTLCGYVKEVLIMAGMHRSMTTERLDDEAKSTTALLYRDILEDGKYHDLRVGEIEYCFRNGLKGRLTKNPDVVITYRSMLYWLESYVSHPVYKNALTAVHSRPIEPKRQLEQSAEDKRKAAEKRQKDYIDLVLNAYKDWKQYMKEKSEGEDIATAHPGTLGALIGLPPSCCDIGGYKMAWLRENGFATDDETLLDVFARAKSRNGKFERL